jgi:dihydrofolate reductase
MKIAAIVAMTPNRVIGADNQIPWYLPADLKYFKKVTTGHPVIMGRKCFESIGRPLPKRTNIVLSKNPFFIASGIVRALSPEDALLDAQVAAKEAGTDTIFIIGGAEIYKLFWDQTELLYLTEVHTDAEGDVYFPEVKDSEWKLISEEYKKAEGKNEFGATYKIYERRS